MMKDARINTGWLLPHIGYREPTLLTTSIAIDEEIFASLEYVSEIEEVGIDLVKSRGTKYPKRAFILFQSFIRQGKTFYDAAKDLHFRASALNYYYAFLNLVKAYISLSTPDFVKGRVQHGLTPRKFKPSPLHRQGIYITKEAGVFHKFYELTIGRSLPKSLRLNIVTLLGYCSDIKHEYENAGFGVHRLVSVKCRYASHKASKIAWPVLAAFDFDSLEPYKKSLSQFYSYFERISPNIRFCHNAFKLTGELIRYFTYFQSINPNKWIDEINIDVGKLREEVLSACGNLFEPQLYDDDFEFKLTLPLRLNFQIPFNQPLSIYAVMFYIGSLVRYQPAYLEKLLNSKDAWMIERFVRGSTTTFLRYISNMILNVDNIYTQR